MFPWFLRAEGNRILTPQTNQASLSVGKAQAAFCCASHSQAPGILLTLTGSSPWAANVRQKNTVKHPPHLGGKDSRLLPEEKKAEMQEHNLCWSTARGGLAEADSAAGWARMVALPLSEATTQGVKGLNSAMWQTLMPTQLHLCTSSLLPAPFCLPEQQQRPPGSSPRAGRAPSSLMMISNDLVGIQFQPSRQEQSRPGSAMGREGCFHSLHISLRFAFQTGHRTYPKTTWCPDSSSEKTFHGKGAECFYGRAQSSGQRMAKLFWCVGWTFLFLPSLPCCLLSTRRKSKLCPCLAVVMFPSRCCLCVHLCTSPEQRLWAQQKDKTSKWAQNFPWLHCQAQSLWKHLKVNLII